jgi:hypothetical protein
MTIVAGGEEYPRNSCFSHRRFSLGRTAAGHAELDGAQEAANPSRVSDLPYSEMDKRRLSSIHSNVVVTVL